jgi:hypothetical protein
MPIIPGSITPIRDTPDVRADRRTSDEAKVAAFQKRKLQRPWRLVLPIIPVRPHERTRPANFSVRPSSNGCGVLSEKFPRVGFWIPHVFRRGEDASQAFGLRRFIRVQQVVPTPIGNL